MILNTTVQEDGQIGRAALKQLTHALTIKKTPLRNIYIRFNRMTNKESAAILQPTMIIKNVSTYPTAKEKKTLIPVKPCLLEPPSEIHQ